MARSGRNYPIQPILIGGKATAAITVPRPTVFIINAAVEPRASRSDRQRQPVTKVVRSKALGIPAAPATPRVIQPAIVAQADQRRDQKRQAGGVRIMHGAVQPLGPYPVLPRLFDVQTRRRPAQKPQTLRVNFAPPAPTATPLRTTWLILAPSPRPAKRPSRFFASRAPAPQATPLKVVTIRLAGQLRRRSGRVITTEAPPLQAAPLRGSILIRTARTLRRRLVGRIILPGRRPTAPPAPTGPIVLSELLGYVADLSDVGIPNQLLGSGLVTLDATGIPSITGDTGYPTLLYAPQDVCVLGYSNQNLGTTDIPTIEAEIGRSFHGLRQNQQYTNTSISTAITEYDAGRTLSYRSIQFNTAPGGWAAAATGTFDTQLVALCNAITAANRWTTQNPFWLCLHHEATTSGGVFGTPGFSAADHIAMWQHCVPVMRATGAPIKFAYVGWDRMFVGLNGVGPPDPGEGFDDLDPGTAYYDRIGSDPYNAVDSPGVLRYGTDAAVLLEPIRLAAVARGMDWMMGEMGCQDGSTTQDHVNKAAWTDSLRTYLDGLGTIGPGVCRVMLTTHESANLYQADTSAESLAAWQRLGFDSYYS